MQLDQGAEVEVGEHVAVEHQEALVEEALGEPDRAGRAARLGLLDVAQTRPPVTALAERRPARRLRRKPHAMHDVVDTVARQPVDHVAR